MNCVVRSLPTSSCPFIATPMAMLSGSLEVVVSRRLVVADVVGDGLGGHAVVADGERVVARAQVMCCRLRLAVPGEDTLFVTAHAGYSWNITCCVIFFIGGNVDSFNQRRVSFFSFLVPTTLS